MPKRRLDDPLHSIGIFMESLRQLQSDAERELERGTSDPAPTARQRKGGIRPASPLRTSIEKQLAEVLAKLLKRLDLPSRNEIEVLSHRVARLEEGIETRRAVRRRRSKRSHNSDDRR